jgi:hypothetical protein
VTVFAGDVIYASDLNAIYDATVGKPIGRATQSAAQALPDASFTAITLTSEEFDTHDFHSTTTNTSRVTPTVGGYYRFTGTVSFEATTTPVAVDVCIRKNGSSLVPGVTRNIGGTTILGQQVTSMVAMNGTTDYVELAGRQDSAGADNTQVNLPITSVLEWEFVRPL